MSLDLPARDLSPRAFAWAIGLATAVGLLLRVLWPELRPIHHDEAVNWYFAGRVLNSGLYEYDPANYHGPTFHYLAALGRGVLGDRLLALRMPMMLVGAAMVPMCAWLRVLFGRRGAAAVAWTIALSPSLVFYARDAIHETLLAALTLLAVYAAAACWTGGRATLTGNAGLLGGALAGMVATKETAALTFAGWGVGLVVALLMAGRPAHERLGRLLGAGGWRRPLLALLGVGLAVIVITFTGFRRPQALLDLLSTLQIWAARGAEGAGHEKPWHVFPLWLWLSEAPLILLALGAAIRGLWRRDPLDALLLCWSLVALAAYSAISYKTPWCVIQVSLPVALLAGRGLGDLWALAGGSRALPLRLAAGLVALLLLTAATVRAVDYSFVRHDDRETPLVYVQTHREVEQAMAAIVAVRDAVGEGVVLRHLHRASYPFNWYLRPNGPQREEREPLPDDLAGADAMMTEPGDSLEIQARLDGSYLWRRFKFRDTLSMDVWVAERHSGLLGDLEGWDPVEPTAAP